MDVSLVFYPFIINHYPIADDIKTISTPLIHADLRRRLELVPVNRPLAVPAAIQLVAAVLYRHRVPEIHQTLRDMKVHPGLIPGILSVKFTI